VRPEIPVEDRVNANSQIFVLKNEHNEPIAVTCVKFLADIPESVNQIWLTPLSTPIPRCFIPSGVMLQGAGRELIDSG
jgi:hypothetical protein